MKLKLGSQLNVPYFCLLNQTIQWMPKRTTSRLLLLL
ncbi:unnamed protein product [Linum tenue]|uniref:Uncharacterized protein n=1 Tax=Linum tenue TaxID=586396 RepID=A0AAV0PQI2_9ROSI|nr:unnamed protein product [Linum tenue]